MSVDRKKERKKISRIDAPRAVFVVRRPCVLVAPEKITPFIVAAQSELALVTQLESSWLLAFSSIHFPASEGIMKRPAIILLSVLSFFQVYLSFERGDWAGGVGGEREMICVRARAAATTWRNRALLAAWPADSERPRRRMSNEGDRRDNVTDDKTQERVSYTPEGGRGDQLPLEPDGGGKPKRPRTLPAGHDIVVVPRKDFIKGGGRFEASRRTGISGQRQLIRHTRSEGDQLLPVRRRSVGDLRPPRGFRVLRQALSPTADHNVGLQYITAFPTPNKYSTAATFA